MEPFKLRVRIEPRAFEFEAEGDRESVERQFDNFQEFVRSTPIIDRTRGETPKAPGPGEDDSTENGSEDDDELPPDDLPKGDVWAVEAAAFKKIFGVDGQVVYLSAPPHTPDGTPDLARSGLLLVYGYRLYKGLDGVGGKDLMEGLSKSGFTVLRADRVLDQYIGGADAQVMRFGKKRGVRYRLTNKGLIAVRTLAKELTQMVS